MCVLLYTYLIEKVLAAEMSLEHRAEISRTGEVGVECSLRTVSCADLVLDQRRTEI